MQDLDGEPLFCATDIASLIGDKNYRHTLKHYSSACARIVGCPDVHGRAQRTKFLTRLGLNHYLVTSRQPKAKALAAKLGITSLVRYESKETETIAQIVSVFGETYRHQRQKTVVCGERQYRIDLYFEDELLAIECDEDGHRDRCPKAEMERQSRIEAELGCAFLRYNPDAVDFDIFRLLGKIQAHFARNTQEKLRLGGYANSPVLVNCSCARAGAPASAIGRSGAVNQTVTSPHSAETLGLNDAAPPDTHSGRASS